MMWILLFVAILVIMLIPQWWTQRILKKYSEHRPDFPGTGGEFARHLIAKQDLNVKLETTSQGDHYDPNDRAVRLSEDNYSGQSLTAVVVAAHEVGHAMQHQQRMALLLLRTPLAKFAFYIERIAQVALISTPLLLSFIPVVGRISMLLVIFGILGSFIVHLITLPVEFNASFSKALPEIKKGGYLSNKDYKAAQRILLACALTYVSGALASLLNVWRWLRFFRR